MLFDMYMWDLLGHDTSEGPLCSGAGNELAAVMRLTEPLLVERLGFIVHVVEVVSRMSVFHLDAVHVPTGRECTRSCCRKERPPTFFLTLTARCSSTYGKTLSCPEASGLRGHR